MSDPSASASERAEWRRQLKRLSLRLGIKRPPTGLSCGEAYRGWLLEHVIDPMAVLDATDSERQETQMWRNRIARSSSAELWGKYRDVSLLSPSARLPTVEDVQAELGISESDAEALCQMEGGFLDQVTRGRLVMGEPLTQPSTGSVIDQSEQAGD